MSGTELSDFQDHFAHTWNNNGPDEVYRFIKLADRSVLEQLVMANIGKRAQDLESQA